METIRNFFDQHKILSLLFVVMLITGVLCLLFSKEQSFLLLNFFHCRLLDQFFIVYTFLGDGLCSLATALLLFLLKNRLLAYRALLAFLISGMLAQIVKKMVPAPRPLAVLGTTTYQHFIEGVTHSGFNSFPSGHTTSVFALMLLCCFQIKDFRIQLLLFFLACLTAYSRIYLGQHFLPDVFAGMLIGSVTAIGVYLFIKYPLFVKKGQRLQEPENIPA